MPEILNLNDTLKGYTYDQDKLLTPEETIRRVRERLGALDLKLLQDTRRIDTGRLDIPVYLSLLGVDARRVVPTPKPPPPRPGSMRTGRSISCPPPTSPGARRSICPSTGSISSRNITARPPATAWQRRGSRARGKGWSATRP